MGPAKFVITFRYPLDHILHILRRHHIIQRQSQQAVTDPLCNLQSPACPAKQLSGRGTMKRNIMKNGNYAMLFQKFDERRCIFQRSGYDVKYITVRTAIIENERKFNVTFFSQRVSGAHIHNQQNTTDSICHHNIRSWSEYNHEEISRTASPIDELHPRFDLEKLTVHFFLD